MLHEASFIATIVVGFVLALPAGNTLTDNPIKL